MSHKEHVGGRHGKFCQMVVLCKPGALANGGRARVDKIIGGQQSSYIKCRIVDPDPLHHRVMLHGFDSHTVDAEGGLDSLFPHFYPFVGRDMPFCFP